MSFNTDLGKVKVTGNLNAINDSQVASTYTSITGGNLYNDFLGSIITLSNDDAVAHSSTSVGTLYEGRYQYVQVLSTATQAPARGRIVFWIAANIILNTASRYIVTTDADDGNQAGVLLSAPTKGNYCWMQIDGIASVLFTGVLTKSTPAAKDCVYVKSSDGTADVIADATNVTSPILRRWIGVAQQAVTFGAINRVELFQRFANY